MQQFFDSLRTNLESLEQLPHEDKEALLGQHVASIAGTWTLSSLLHSRPQTVRGNILYCILASCYIRFTLNICSFVHQCNTFTFFIFYYSSTCFGLTWPSSGVTVYSPKAGALLCQFFAYVMLPAMCFCWCCAYCQCPFVRIFVLSLWPPCCLSTNNRK
jgi:hypothetical protein